ncbi:acid phosphatase type 7-like [Centruroides vittatus]|uniref:acid phosphatase type 7-like n=1 Tax=Centruroides vittatus TaxID=120091 RepID=UPI00350FD1C8
MLIFLFIILKVCLASEFQPEQIHLSLGDNPDEMVVMWNTKDNPGVAKVEYGPSPSKLIYLGIGISEQLNHGLLLRLTRQFVHKVRLQKLLPNVTYWYRCGNNKNWSQIYKFTTHPRGYNWSPKLLIFGDLGLRNARSMPSLEREVWSGKWNLLFHNGDIAYDMNSRLGTVGDDFMNMIQPIASVMPYMVSVGNHEIFGDFRDYKARFDMPGEHDNMMYSFKMGPALFVVISTEFYYFLRLPQLDAQYKWLNKILAEANLPNNRAQTPWIIVIGHRPMYCSNKTFRDCSWDFTLTRNGLPLLNYGLEEILYKYGVDLAIWGHQHSYERTWPLYDNKVYNGSIWLPYHNPKATVHITSGCAGNKERVLEFKEHKPHWSAFRSSTYGYLRMVVHNASHLELEQMSADQFGDTIDHFLIKKDKHGPYPKLFPNNIYR